MINRATGGPEWSEVTVGRTVYKHALQLRHLIDAMGSHSDVTCHPAQPLPSQIKLVLNLTTPEGWEAEFWTWPDYRPRWYTRSNAVTRPSTSPWLKRVLLRSCDERRYHYANRQPWPYPRHHPQHKPRCKRHRQKNSQIDKFCFWGSNPLLMRAAYSGKILYKYYFDHSAAARLWFTLSIRFIL